jgi:hypothetical protein
MDTTLTSPPERAQPASARRGFAVDPDERVRPVLSIEPPPRRKARTARRLVVAKKIGIAVVSAVFAVILLAFIAERADEPVRAPAQGVSMR